MLLDFIRYIWGYNYQWEEYFRTEYKNGTQFLFICKKTGKMKKVWMGL